MATYDIGTDIQMTGTFRDLTGALADPSTVTAKLIDPTGSETTLSPSKVSTGVYNATFTPSLSGWHYYRFAGTGSVTAAGEGAFYVKEQKVP